MSTAWMPEFQLEAFAMKVGGFEFEQVIPEFGPREAGLPKEFRLTKNGIMAFRGDADRCSDYLVGFVAGKASVR